MRNWWTYGVGTSLSIALAMAIGGGCGSTGDGHASFPEADAGGDKDGAASFRLPDEDGSAEDGGAAACTTFSAEAKAKPAAMLIVLDRTASMSQLGKWAAAQTAIVDAIDKDVFDSM